MILYRLARRKLIVLDKRYNCTEKSFRLNNGVEKGPFLTLLRGGGKGGGVEVDSPFGGRGGLTDGTILSSACKCSKQ